VITIATKENGDFDFGKKLEGKNALIQNVIRRLKLLYSEAFFSVDFGIDYFGYLGLGEYNFENAKEYMATQIAREVLSCYKVQGIKKLDFSFQNKKLNINLIAIIDNIEEEITI